MTKVSIIVPIYNVEKYLARCLDSIINQTVKEIEIICVNDGATDDSAKILNEYSQKDKRIRVINRVNGGLSAARNTGLKTAVGHYILFVDSDDWIEQNTVALALAKIEEDNEIDFVSFGANIVLENVDEEAEFIYGQKKYHTLKLFGKQALDADIICDTTVTAWNKLFKKSIIDAYRLEFPEGLLYEDNAFFYTYCLHAKYGYYLDRYLYNYVQRPNSIMGQMSQKKSDKIVDRLKVFKIVYDYYKAHNALSQFAQLISVYFTASLWNDYNHCAQIYKGKVLSFVSQMAKDLDPNYFEPKLIQNLIKKRYSKINIIKRVSFCEKIFSIKNEKGYKVLRLMGAKIKLFKKKESFKKMVKREIHQLWHYSNEINQSVSFVVKQAERLTRQNEKQLNDLNFKIQEIESIQKQRLTIQSDKQLSDLNLKIQEIESTNQTLSTRLFQYENNIDFFIMNQFLFERRSNISSIKKLISDANHITGFFYENRLEDIHQNLKYLFNGHLNPYHFNNQNIDFVYLWGIKPSLEQSQIILYAQAYQKPIVIIEDSFLRSVCTWADNTKEAKYRADCSFVIDDLTCYYDATHSSRLERMLNDENLIITTEERKRARACIDRIISTHLTKYNHQPIYTPDIGRKGVKKILVVDQSYGDMSITKGLANDSTFKEMLAAAIQENKGADIIIKTHPDTMVGHGTGYYTHLNEGENIYKLTDPINPISLIQYVDKVYVCTTQFGFEALMCGKEVHVFGMPFYAGWGLTHDRQKCKRRTNIRTLEDIFYITYILYSYYVNPDKKQRCEIEEVMDYLLSLREQYFNTFGIKTELIPEI